MWKESYKDSPITDASTLEKTIKDYWDKHEYSNGIYLKLKINGIAKIENGSIGISHIDGKWVSFDGVGTYNSVENTLQFSYKKNTYSIIMDGSNNNVEVIGIKASPKAKWCLIAGGITAGVLALAGISIFVAKRLKK